MYRIREVDGEDEDDVIHVLHDACFGDEAPRVQPDEGWWWLVWPKGDKEPVGFAWLKQSERYDNVGYLARAGVLPRHRGHGLQRRLIQVREAKARRLGCIAMVSDTTDNPASGNSLIKAGYHIHRPKLQWGFGLRTIYWRKWLTCRPAVAPVEQLIAAETVGQTLGMVNDRP